MSKQDEETFPDENVALHLDEARGYLLIAQLHLATIEGMVSFEDLIFVRRLIGIAMERVTALDETPAKRFA